MSLETPLLQLLEKSEKVSEADRKQIVILKIYLLVPKIRRFYTKKYDLKKRISNATKILKNRRNGAHIRA